MLPLTRSSALMRSLLLILLCSVCMAMPVRAQQQQEEDPNDPGLPDIAPREVEIRGQLEIAFPALQRPTPTGLLPQTHLQPLPPLSPPQLETSEPITSAPQVLPDGPSSPSDFTEPPPPQTGLIEAGGGRYFSRFANARLDLPLSSQWAFRSRLDYEGTDGFQPFDDSEVEASSDDLYGSATLRTERSGFNASLTADGFLGQHRLYGADSLPGSPTGARPHPARDRFGGGATLHLQSGGRLPLDVRARYDGAKVQTNVFEENNERFERSEQRFRGSVQTNARLSGLRVEADAQGSTARLSGGTDRFAGAVSFLDAGAGAWLLHEDAYRFFAGARVLSFSSTGDDGTYVAPDLRLEWQAVPRLTLYARTDPGAEAHLLADRYRENPSLLYEDAPQPALYTLDAEGGVRFFPSRAVELQAFAGYERAPSYLFYEEAQVDSLTAPLYRRGVTSAHYGEARILQAGGSLSFRRTEQLHASLSVTFRNGQLATEETDIPYFSPVTAQALFAYGFADGKGRLQLTGSLQSARPLSRTSEEQVDTFADLDVEGTYALTPAVGVVVRLRNLMPGALERYNRYPRPPLVIESGLRVNM